jgi:hypothetical protein
LAQRFASIVPLILGLLLAALPAPAEAYVRYRYNSTGPEFYWGGPAGTKESCKTITVYLNGFTEMTLNEVAKSVAAAAHTWSPDEVTCGSGVNATHPYFEIVPSMSVDGAPTPRAMYDARNSLIFQTQSWAYDYRALALTSVFAKSDGHIVDADIEVNAVPGDHDFANLDDPTAIPKNSSALYDLQNTLTHEFGHFIGLDHTCFTADPTMPFQVRPKDDMGNDIPDCSDAPEAIQATVMFNRADVLETSKRVLSSDEIRAVCDIYPEAQDPKSCPLDVPNDGCAVRAPARRGRHGLLAGAGAAGLLAALAFLSGRRGRRRGRRG